MKNHILNSILEPYLSQASIEDFFSLEFWYFCLQTFICFFRERHVSRLFVM